jgi:phage terminase large subunit GpA-like protein
MSDSSSQSGPSQLYVSQAEDLARATWCDGQQPEPILTVSEWSDENRYLSQKAASEPGRWRTDRTPYLRAIMDALSASSPIQRVVFEKGAQIGATESGLNWIGYVIDQAPGPMLSVAPTVDMAKRYSKQRVAPMIEESPALRDSVADSRSRDSGNTVLAKEFAGGVLVMTGANSAVGLRSMPARYVFLDEVDGYPGDVDGEGDPVALAEARTRTFQRRKIYMVSTPTIAGRSRIDREFSKSDQRRFFVPCPHCDHYQTLQFKQLKWPKLEPARATYWCEDCAAEIGEEHKTEMLRRGEWRATAEGDGRTVGFHLSSMYSPVGWMSWVEIAQRWEAAQGDPELLKEFINTGLVEVIKGVGNPIKEGVSALILTRAGSFFICAYSPDFH